MNIVFLQDDFPPYAKGGAGIVADSFAQELVRNGNTLTIITSVQDHAKAGSFYEDGLRIERIYSDYAQRWRSWRSLYNPSTIPAIQRLLSEIKPDVVHAHNVHYHLSYYALRLARQNGAKVFLTAHDVMLFHYGKLTEFVDVDNTECRKKWNYKISPLQQLRAYRFWYNPFRNFFIRKLLKNVDKIFAVSYELKDALEQNGIKNIEVLHNSIDTDSWKVSDEVVSDFVKKHHLENKKVILFGGRISGAKGGDIMLEVLRDVVKSEPSAVLLLLGTRTEYVEKLIQRAQEWGIGANIISVGWVSGDELRGAYWSSTLVVMPSVYLEPFGMIALEAMACGKPVVGSCFGGIPEVIENEMSGFVVNPYDHKSLVNSIIRLIKNKSESDSFGVFGKRRAEDLFALGNNIKLLLDKYKMSYILFL